jgi:hypothetical protein
MADRKRSFPGLGPEIAESKVEESGITDSKTIQYPVIFTPPPRKLLAYVFDQFLLDGGFHYAFSVPGCNISVEIEESCKYTSGKSVTKNQTEFHCDIVFEDAFIPRKLLIHSADGDLQVSPRLFCDVPDRTDTNQYESAFVQFLSEFREEEIYFRIFRQLWLSPRNQHTPKQLLTVTLRMRGRINGEDETREIFLPSQTHLLNAIPISWLSPVRFSQGINLAPEFRHGQFQLQLALFKSDHSVIFAYPKEEVCTRTTFEELAKRVLLKHGWHVVEFRDGFSKWTLEHEGDFKKSISEVVFEHYGRPPFSLVDDARMLKARFGREYVLKTYCKL